MAQYQALADRRKEEQNRAQLNAGIVAAQVANAFRGEGGRAVSAIDYVPDYKKLEQQSLEEQIAIISKEMGCGPGRAASFVPKGAAN